MKIMNHCSMLDKVLKEQVSDTETSAQTEDRNTLRRIDMCLSQGQPSHTVATHVPFQSDDTGASTKDATASAISS